MPSLTGKTAIVTGANTGLGFETALALYQAGAHVVLVCRSHQKAVATLARLQKQSGAGTLEPAVLDLSNLSTINQFADAWLQTHDQLHLLINNAGVATPPAAKTAEGYELQFGVNFLGHFALTGRLYSLLRATTGSRIVTLSSNGYQGARIAFDNLKSEVSYDPLREYRQSKLANLLFSVELDRRIREKGDAVVSVAVQPGANKTELTRHLSAEDVAIGVQRLGEFMEPWQGALSILYAAVSPAVSGGHLYGPDQEGGFRGYPGEAVIAPNALDEAVARQLWQVAEQITGVPFP